MTSTVKLMLTTVLAAACLGSMAARGLQAQSQPAAPAYVINEVEVTDAPGFAIYAARQGVLIGRFGGKFLARGGEADSVAGAQPHRVTIYVFDSMTKARAWRDAPEQKELAVIRDKASHFRSFIVEGCASCAPPAG
ncbi:MAG TPA: DUF1330 domain-containing protein [Stellaceae bacterium]|nr:DUF1330 domain-containing protein [Stellaceae bacterium]